MIFNGNQMEKAILNAGLASEPKPQRKPRHKKFTCHQCGAPMEFVDNTNVMVCSSCKQFFIFDN